MPSAKSRHGVFIHVSLETRSREKDVFRTLYDTVGHLHHVMNILSRFVFGDIKYNVLYSNTSSDNSRHSAKSLRVTAKQRSSLIHFALSSNLHVLIQCIALMWSFYSPFLTLNIPRLARQRCLQAGVFGGPLGFFVISQPFDAVDYSNYVFWVSETIIQWFKHC